MARFVENGTAITRLLQLTEISNGTAKAIFEAVDAYFTKHQLEYKNLVGFSSDVVNVYTPVAFVLQADKTSELAKELAPHFISIAFKYWVAFMDDLCGELNKLSKVLQTSDLNVVDVLPQVVLRMRNFNNCFVTRSIQDEALTVTRSLKEFYRLHIKGQQVAADMIAMHEGLVQFASRVLGFVAIRFPQESQTVIGYLAHFYPHKLIEPTAETELRRVMANLASHYSNLIDTSELQLEFSTWKEFVNTKMGLFFRSNE